MSIQIADAIRAMGTVVGIGNETGSNAITANLIMMPSDGYVSSYNQSPAVAIASIVPGATTIVQTLFPHGFASGNTVFLSGVLGLNNVNGVNSNITVLSATAFQFVGGSASTGTYVAGSGTAVGFGDSNIFETLVTSHLTAGTPPIVTVSLTGSGAASLNDLGIFTGQIIGLQMLGGDDALNTPGYYQITVTGATTFTLNGATSATTTSTTGLAQFFTPQGCTLITSIAQDTTGQILVTDTGNPQRQTGNFVRLSNIPGTNPPNGRWQVQVLSPTQYYLVGSLGTGFTGASSGVVNGSYGSTFNFSADPPFAQFVLDDNLPVTSTNPLAGAAFALSNQSYVQAFGTTNIGESFIQVVNIPAEEGDAPGVVEPFSLTIFRDPNAQTLGS